MLTELATALARLLSRGGNLVGAILYNNSVERTIPPRTGRNHVLHLTRELLRPPEPTGTSTDLAGLVVAGAQTIKRRSLVIVLSDFISVPGWERPLSMLSQRHEVVAIRLFDPREQRSSRCGLDRGGGRRDGRVALGRHERSGVPSSLRRVRARARRRRPWPRRGKPRSISIRSRPRMTWSARSSASSSCGADGDSADVVRVATRAGFPRACAAARPGLREADAAARAPSDRALRAGLRAERGGAADAAATARAVRALPRRAHVAVVLPCSPAGESEPAGARGNRDSRVRRLQQHARATT